MKVQFLDLHGQYLSIKPEIDAALEKVFESSAYSGGPFVKAFEDNFAAAHKVSYCLGVNNGTSAIHLPLMALGIGAGDEVIVPANTFFATPEAVSLAGATPVFVDCDSRYYNIDPQKIEAAITSKTRAIIAVHLYGQMAQISRVKEIADKHGLVLLEDCAQAHLASLDGTFAGASGICGCFSFYPGKNLGAYGEGGAVVTNDRDLYLKMSAMRNHGSERKYYHDYVGHNYRLEGIQGAVLDVKLRYLPKWTELRQKNASLYREALQGLDQVALPEEQPNTRHVYHLFVVRAERREELMKHLEGAGISTGIHYPVPCHMQKAYEFLGYEEGSMPVSERYSREILSLPMYPELREDEISYVSDKVREFYRQ